MAKRGSWKGPDDGAGGDAFFLLVVFDFFNLFFFFFLYLLCLPFVYPFGFARMVIVSELDVGGMVGERSVRRTGDDEKAVAACGLVVVRFGWCGRGLRCGGEMNPRWRWMNAERWGARSCSRGPDVCSYIRVRLRQRKRRHYGLCGGKSEAKTAYTEFCEELEPLSRHWDHLAIGVRALPPLHKWQGTAKVTGK